MSELQVANLSKQPTRASDVRAAEKTNGMVLPSVERVARGAVSHAGLFI